MVYDTPFSAGVRKPGDYLEMEGFAWGEEAWVALLTRALRSHGGSGPPSPLRLPRSFCFYSVNPLTRAYFSVLPPPVASSYCCILNHPPVFYPLVLSQPFHLFGIIWCVNKPAKPHKCIKSHVNLLVQSTLNVQKDGLTILGPQAGNSSNAGLYSYF